MDKWATSSLFAGRTVVIREYLCAYSENPCITACRGLDGLERNCGRYEAELSLRKMTHTFRSENVSTIWMEWDAVGSKS